MAHKTEFKHKACGTELRMDVDLEDHFYRAPTEVTKIYCPTCRSLFATNAFEWLDGSGPVEPGHPDNELPEPPPEVNNDLPETGEEVPPEVDQGDERPNQDLPGDQPEVDHDLPEGEQPVDPGYGVDEGDQGEKPSQGGERPDQSLPGDQPSPGHDLPDAGRNVNLDPDLDPDLGRKESDGAEPKRK